MKVIDDEFIAIESDSITIDKGIFRDYSKMEVETVLSCKDNFDEYCRWVFMLLSKLIR
jgi:hypothetical protein